MVVLRHSLASTPAAAGRSWMGARTFAIIPTDQPRGT
jgi:hypothetical protein